MAFGFTDFIFKYLFLISSVELLLFLDRFSFLVDIFFLKEIWKTSHLDWWPKSSQVLGWFNKLKFENIPKSYLLNKHDSNLWNIY